MYNSPRTIITLSTYMTVCSDISSVDVHCIVIIIIILFAVLLNLITKIQCQTILSYLSSWKKDQLL